MDQLGKIRRHHWKERLNISSNAKFESDTSQAIEHIASKSRRKLKIYDVCMGYKWGGGGGGGGGGQVCALYHTNVCKISRL